MTLPAEINRLALKPLELAANSKGGKLLLPIQIVVSLVAIPIILVLGILEALVRACKFDGFKSIGNALSIMGSAALIQLAIVIISPFLILCGKENMQKITESLSFSSFVLSLNASSAEKAPFRPDFKETDETIDFSRVKFKKFPTELSICKNLKKLHSHSNRLTEAPDLKAHPELETVTIFNNLLTQGPNLSGCPRLTELDLHLNQLNRSPDLSGCPELTKLNLGCNKLSVSPDLSANEKLKDISLSGNELIDPPVLGNKPHLVTLNLTWNRLTTFPDLSQCPKLQYIYLSHNQLSTIDESILSLPSLEWIHLGENNFTEEYKKATRLRANTARSAGQHFPNISF